MGINQWIGLQIETGNHRFSHEDQFSKRLNNFPLISSERYQPGVFLYGKMHISN